MKKLKFLIVLMSLFLVPSFVSNAEECEHDLGDWDYGRYIDGIYAEEPTCISDGIQIRWCERCDYYETRVIKADPKYHYFSEWDTIYEDCQDGEYYRTCQYCGKEEKKPKKATKPHDWDGWEVVEPNNCLNSGKKSRECKQCWETETQVIPADPNKHEWSNWYASKGATALKKGEKYRCCYVCDTEETAVIPKLKATITLKKKSLKLKRGKKYNLSIKKKTYGDKIKKWTSSNKKIVAVDKKGKLKAKKKGKATITLYMKSGCKAECKVTVK